METMHAAGRRTLPPVPRTLSDRGPARPSVASTDTGEAPEEIPTQRFVVDFSTGERRLVRDVPDDRPTEHATSADDASEDDAGADDASADDAPADDAPEDDALEDDAELESHRTSNAPLSLDAAQLFVERLRSFAPDFAEAAGAESAVVSETVPPARHRRSRCRVVLHYADGTAADVTFLGPAGAPGSPSRHGFDRQIRRWLETGQRRDSAWLVPDEDASDGLAVDVSAWLTAG
jgi:hypothetical protein